ncbi:MAG TPA: dockerin type I domain-containing protein, partial [Tepidisphaeraceae bacterium]|nr:dockerin type I domain-containing protein [Tepidisphaeraceae bacterium]
PADGPAPVATVAGRHVFYNNSVYDGSSAVADARDDAAIAPDKWALLPGQTATFANYTGYSRGINGVMLDVRDLPAGTSLDASDFRFRTSASASPTSFTTAVTPSSVTVRRGAGAGGSDRVTITFPDGAVRNTWLQVTMLANGDTGLSAPDVSYFGNMVGETGDRPSRDADVTAIDYLRTAAALFSNPASIASRHDHNRDGRVSVTDLAMVRRNLFTPPLRLITAPAAAPSATEMVRENA